MECKNEAIVRKYMGFAHIAAPHAEAVDFHRPCAVPEIETEPNGKRRRVYRKWATPFEIFSQTPQCESYPRPGVSMADLKSIAEKQSDTEAAIEMQDAKRRLMAGIARRSA